MVFDKITDEELEGKGVVGLEDTPGLSTLEMQEKFDEIALAVLVPAFNALADKLMNAITDTLVGTTDKIPSGRAVANAIQQAGGGDMLQATYDIDGDGSVDGMGGHLADYYVGGTLNDQDIADIYEELYPTEEV